MFYNKTPELNEHIIKCSIETLYVYNISRETLAYLVPSFFRLIINVHGLALVRYITMLA